MGDVQAIMARLREPFAPSDIEWRVQRAVQTRSGNKAIVLAYITARAVMERLDEVFGIDGWTDSYQRWGDRGVLCTISCRIGDEWISRTDGADDTNIEATKGGISDSFKRAAVKWGIGRYLYRIDESWVDIRNESGEHYINTEVRQGNQKVRIQGYWDPPPLPAWAIPVAATERQGKGSEPSRPKGKIDGSPVTERQLARLYAISNQAQCSSDEMKALIRNMFRVNSSKALNRRQYDELCSLLEARIRQLRSA